MAGLWFTNFLKQKEMLKFVFTFVQEIKFKNICDGDLFAESREVFRLKNGELNNGG